MFTAMGGLLGVIADRYYPPDLAYVTNTGYLDSIVDTLQMSFLGGIFEFSCQFHWPGFRLQMFHLVEKCYSLLAV